MGVLLGRTYMIADKSVSGNTTAQSILGLAQPTNILIPDYFDLGKKLCIRLRGYFTKGVGNLTINVTLNGVTVLTTGSFITGVANQAGFELEFGLNIRAIGVNGKIRGQGKFFNFGTGSVFQLVSLSDTTIDTTITQTYDITSQWSSLNVGNNITVTNISHIITD